MTTRQLIQETDNFRLWHVFNDDGEFIGSDEEPIFPPGLDATGVVTTLLVVQNVLSLTDGANALGMPESTLVQEAQAWAIARDLNKQQQ